MEAKTIIVLVLVVLFLGCSFILIAHFVELNKKNHLDRITEELILEKCKNKSLLDTVSCVNDYHKIFYKYVIMDDAKNLTFEELRDSGGDCKDHTLWSEKIFDKLGFQTQEVRINMSYEVIGNITYINGHLFLVVHDKDNYCVVDAAERFCGLNYLNYRDFKS